MPESGELLGYVVIDGDDLMLGTPMFAPDDRESAEACVEGDAFVAEVRHPREFFWDGAASDPDRSLQRFATPANFFGMVRPPTPTFRAASHREAPDHG